MHADISLLVLRGLLEKGFLGYKNSNVIPYLWICQKYLGQWQIYIFKKVRGPAYPDPKIREDAAFKLLL